jgi:hemolysin type calcium-binding protein
MLRARRRQAGTLESVVGARGIGFGQSRKQRLQAYGFPGGGRPAYDGTRLIRCDSRQSADPGRFGGPRGRGIRCDMGRGASGGGWVAQRAIVVSNTSHAYSRRARGRIFGPYYGKAIKRLYRAKLKGWPSIGPVRCEGRVATIVGTDRPERLRGSRGRDVIAALGGNDVVRGGKGEDLICGGDGRDGLSGNGGRDRLVGGPGSDECRGGGGRDRVRCRRVA